MTHRYLTSLRNEIWAMLDERLMVIEQLIAMRLAGERFTDDELKARLGDAPRRPDLPQTSGAVAVLPLFGVMAKRMDMFAAISGGTSTQRYAQDFTAAVNDPSVKSILMVIDSPGGTVSGTAELGETVFRARGVKPIVAQVDGMAASAALWVASQADEIVATPSAELGSIGVLQIHQEASKKLENEGITTNIMRIPANKVAVNAYEPLSKSGRADIEAKMAAVYDQFVGAVARGRGVSNAKVEKDFGGGLTMFADDALSVGLVDRIAPIDDTIARLLGGKSSGGRMRAQDLTDAELVAACTDPEEADRLLRLRLL